MFYNIIHVCEHLNFSEVSNPGNVLSPPPSKANNKSAVVKRVEKTNLFKSKKVYLKALPVSNYSFLKHSV